MPEPTKEPDVQAAEIRFLESTDVLLAAAERVRKDREVLFRTILEARSKKPKQEAVHAS